ncbi:hypothetical protein LGQ02_15920 [Bacillus shivajii]|uniref:hypothetical protein n=1 Tax=Bacillus shivajii TaxID=1983719 RepID=UPI001CFB1C67|nr:hypothetical protein [Bacillus shivajii]UCZ52318.1 hypothetical protein LGQ02_15920 [Bacillus shivajii]
MKDGKATFIIDFEKMKEKKQIDAENSLLDVYDELFQYIEKKANLREKVRAKHIFSYKAGIPKSEVMDPDMHMHFEHWFAFDYVTVFGSRMFDLFIRDKKDKMSKSMLELSGFLLLMSLEPVRLKKVEKSVIIYDSLLKNETKEATPFIFPAEGEAGELVLMRTVQVGYKQMKIGPTIRLNDEGQQKILKDFHIDEHTNILNQRKHLKEYGIDYLRNKKT